MIIASPNDTHARILDEIFVGATERCRCWSRSRCARAPRTSRRLPQPPQRHRAPIWVAMEYRYMPPVAELIGEVRKGTVGKLQMFSIREHRFPFLPKVGDWNRFNERTGGTMVEKCCHFFDLMRLVVADEPVRVYCSGAADCQSSGRALWRPTARHHRQCLHDRGVQKRRARGPRSLHVRGRRLLPGGNRRDRRQGARRGLRAGRHAVLAGRQDGARGGDRDQSARSAGSGPPKNSCRRNDPARRRSSRIDILPASWFQQCRSWKVARST